MIKTIYDFSPFTSALKLRYYKSLEVSEHSENLEDILQDHPQLLIACNHGSVLGVLAAICAFVELLMTNGGAGRKPLIVAWRYFYQVPYLRRAMAHVTQTEKALSAEELENAFKQKQFTDLFIMPEGDQSLLGDGQQVQHFVSPRFIELALKLELPILIVVHHGTASLAREIKVTNKGLRFLPLLAKWLPEKSLQRLIESGGVNLPKPLSGRCKKLTFSFRVHQPDFSLEQLNAMEEVERHELLEKESERIRGLMQGMINRMC